MTVLTTLNLCRCPEEPVGLDFDYVIWIIFESCYWSFGRSSSFSLHYNRLYLLFFFLFLSTPFHLLLLWRLSRVWRWGRLRRLFLFNRLWGLFLWIVAYFTRLLHLSLLFELFSRCLFLLINFFRFFLGSINFVLLFIFFCFIWHLTNFLFVSFVLFLHFPPFLSQLLYSLTFFVSYIHTGLK